MNYLRPIIFVLIFFCISSCTKDFEEINRNPFYPTQTEIGPLFNQVISSLQLGWDEQFYLHNESLYAVTQLAALTAATFQNISIGTEDVWKNYYEALAHIREIERRIAANETQEGTTAETYNNIKAQLKIIAAYKTFKITDLFGDIPFFDAGRGFEDLAFARPKFDSQEEIYKFLLDELKWAADHIDLSRETDQGIAYQNLDNFDTFLGDNLFIWIKFANSLRLKHALRMYEKDPGYAGNIILEILENDYSLLGNGDDILMHPQQQSWQRESAHWSFREHNKLRMGSTIWNEMAIDNNEASIFDPRAFLFFETNNNGEWFPFPQVPDSETLPSGGAPYASVRDVNYSIKGSGNIYSAFNYYLIRDENTVPEIIMTSAEIQFALAEIYIRGAGVGVDEPKAEVAYSTAVVASVNFWQDLKSGSDIWVNGPDNLSSGEIFAFTNLPQISIFYSNDKLNLIYKQKWINYFRQPWEAFSLLRRTNSVPRTGNQNDFYRFLYPPSEIENNPDNYNAQLNEMGSDSHQTKIWWMN